MQNRNEGSRKDETEREDTASYQGEGHAIQDVQVQKMVLVVEVRLLSQEPGIYQVSKGSLYSYQGSSEDAGMGFV